MFLSFTVGEELHTERGGVMGGSYEQLLEILRQQRKHLWITTGENYDITENTEIGSVSIKALFWFLFEDSRSSWISFFCR